MQKPTSIKFFGLSLTEAQHEHMSNSSIPVVEPEWTRLHFVLPTNADKVEDVYAWLKDHCKGRYAAYKYHDSKTYSDYTMIVRFEDRTDALMFKLQDGHRAWEQRGE